MTAPNNRTVKDVSHGQPGFTKFDRFEEYRIVLEQMSVIQTRRQSTMSLFVGLNVVFLTAIGFLLLSLRFNSWWSVAAVIAICAAIMPLNLIWLQIFRRYASILLAFTQYILEIEREFCQSVAETVGVYTRRGDVPEVRRSGTVQREQSLARYFLILYPLIAVVVVLLTFLVTTNFVSLVNLR